MLILVADDEPALRNSLKEFLEAENEVVLCADGAAALEVLEKIEVDLVITDNLMPKLTGIELIRKGKTVSPGTSFILMSAYGTIEQAIEAIRLGADDYFLKPVEFEELAHKIRRVEDLRSWKAQNAVREEGASSRGLIGGSACIRDARQFIGKVSKVVSPVLIFGPSGSGKEVLARAIHEASPRASRPFIAINCASLSEQLMDSELFGHEKGAFTGATAAKPGKFELAKGGTLFLDEIGELAPSIQAKLLRVLQEKEFFRVGGVRQIKTDARVIAATHRALPEMIKTGAFREDLFFRLHVLSFTFRGLDSRREDLPLLIEHFWKKHCRELGRRVSLSPGALDRLVRHSYPGNVRELQNILERIIVLGPAEGLIDERALPYEFRVRSRSPHEAGGEPAVEARPEDPVLGPGRGLNALLEEYEGRLVRWAMEKSGFNQVKAAELLGISRGALQYKLKKLALPASDAA